MLIPRGKMKYISGTATLVVDPAEVKSLNGRRAREFKRRGASSVLNMFGDAAW
jgi:hypothetical protein